MITHLHGDHFGGLPFLLLDAQFNSRRSTPLLIAGHADLEPRVRAAMDVLFPGSQRALEIVDVEFVVVSASVASDVGPARVEVFDVKHFCGSPPFAIRLTTPTGVIVGYSGDTAWTDTLVRVADGADLFITEAYFYDKKVAWHLDYATLKRQSPRLGARRLIATHMSSDMLGRLDSVDVETAHDGLTIEL